ncbi:hypothetical protein WJX84_003684 [Apatococcus fuscideae]|uniref:JmjC domain-containing protein n=1 Tax=Apatococcus fuscideae TaxID=2026836 RepID=A0AAW1TM16_9CHLO
MTRPAQIQAYDVWLSPEQFWSSHICNRTPVVLKGTEFSAELGSLSRWTDEYLARKASTAFLSVEHRDSPGDSFGKGSKLPIQFGDFLKRLQQHDDSIYLSSQQLRTARDGYPECLGQPLTLLAADFPLRPKLMGGLLPQQINIWMGAAKNGASSGLHHDYHDNLYILLRGQKRFRLFPPSQAPNMYTHGAVAQIHPNGRIVYEGQGRVGADGADRGEVERWQQRRHAEQRLSAAEAACTHGDQGAEEEMAAAEAELEALLESSLVSGRPAKRAKRNHPADKASAEEQHSGEDLSNNTSDEKDDEDYESASDFEHVSNLEDDFRDDYQDSGDEERCNAEAAMGLLSHRGHSNGAMEPDPSPRNFSQIDLSQPQDQLAKKFPKFPGLKAAQEVELEAGQMLYLPAGWFHEVTSFSEAPSQTHLALNYWFQPPDNLDASPAGMAKPYRSEFWPTLWAERHQGDLAKRS